MEPQSVVAALTAIKGATELVKMAVEAKSAEDRRAAVAEIQKALLQAQEQALKAREEQGNLVREVDQLKGEINARDTWAETAALYELAEAGNGNVAFRLRKVGEGQVQHWLCPDCFAARRMSYLAVRPIDVGRSERLDCNACGKQMLTRGQEHAVAQAGAYGRR